MVRHGRRGARLRKTFFRRMVSVDGRDQTGMASYTGMLTRDLLDHSCAPISWTGRNRRKNETKNRRSKIKVLEKIQKNSNICS